jgi:hypothetical protein
VLKRFRTRRRLDVPIGFFCVDLDDVADGHVFPYLDMERSRISRDGLI